MAAYKWDAWKKREGMSKDNRDEKGHGENVTPWLSVIAYEIRSKSLCTIITSKLISRIQNKTKTTLSNDDSVITVLSTLQLLSHEKCLNTPHSILHSHAKTSPHQMTFRLNVVFKTSVVFLICIIHMVNGQ